VENLWRRASELADARGENLASKRHAKLNFHLAKSLYEDMDPPGTAADFVRYCRFLNQLFAG